MTNHTSSADWSLTAEQQSRVRAETSEQTLTALQLGVFSWKVGVPVLFTKGKLNDSELTSVGDMLKSGIEHIFAEAFVKANPLLPTFDFLKSAGAGPSYGVLQLELIVAEDMLEPLSNFLGKMSSEWTRVTRPLCFQIESLLEEKFDYFKMLPPTALWNAGAFARLALARSVLGRYKGQDGVRTYEAKANTVTFYLDGNPVFQQIFKEETLRDLQGLFSYWEHQAHPLLNSQFGKL